MAEYNPRTTNIIALLQNEEQGQLEKVAHFYNSSNQVVEEYSTFPNAQVGDACLARFYSYTGQNLTGERVFVDTWTQAYEDAANPPAQPITDITLDNNTVQDGAGVGTIVGNLFAVGGTNPITFSIVSDPSNKFQIVGNQLQLSDTAVLAESPYSVDIRATDANLDTFDKMFDITVTADFTNTLSTDFDGINEYVRMPNSLTNNIFSDRAYSVSAWVRTQSSGAQAIFSTRRNDSSDRGIELRIDNYRPEFFVQRGAGNRIYVTGNSSVYKQTWTHVAATYDGSLNASGVKLYINGKEIETTIVQDNLVSTDINHTQNSYIGVFGSNLNRFVGFIDEVSFWDRRLSLGEVDEIYNNNIPTDLNDHSAYIDLRSWWRMGDGNIFPIIDDEKGINTGTMINMSVMNFISSTPPEFFNTQSLRFTGSPARVDMPLSSTVQFDQFDPFTLSAWIKPDAVNVNQMIMSNKQGNERGWELSLNTSGELQFVFGTSGSRKIELESNTLIQAGVWTHVLVTHDGTGLAAGCNVYINGVLQIVQVIDDDLNATTVSTTPMSLGRDPGDNNLYFEGNLDSCSIWNDALTASEVQEVWNSGNVPDLSLHSNVADLVHWWRLGDGGDSAVTTFDQAGSLDGALTNFSADPYEEDVP